MVYSAMLSVSLGIIFVRNKKNIAITYTMENRRSKSSMETRVKRVNREYNRYYYTVPNRTSVSRTPLFSSAYLLTVSVGGAGVIQHASRNTNGNIYNIMTCAADPSSVFAEEIRPAQYKCVQCTFERFYSGITYRL